MGIGSSKPKQTQNPMNQNQINRKKDQLGKISEQILKIEKIQDNIEDLLILYERYKTLRIENVELEEHFTQLMTDFVKGLIQNKTDPKDIKYWQQRYKKAVHKQTIGRDIDPNVQAIFTNTVKQTNKAIQQEKKVAIKETTDKFKSISTDMSKEGPQELINVLQDFCKDYPGGNADVDKHFGSAFEKYLSTFYGPGSGKKSLYKYGSDENPITIIQSLYDSYLAATQSYRETIPAIDDKVKSAYSKALLWANELNSQKVPKNVQAVNIKQNQQNLSKDSTIFTPKQQSVKKVISQIAQAPSADSIRSQLSILYETISLLLKKDKRLGKLLTEIDQVIESFDNPPTQQQLLAAKQRLVKIAQQLSNQQQILITPVQQQVAATVQDAVEKVVAQQVPNAPPAIVEQAASDAAQAVVQSQVVQKAVQQGQKQANAQGSTQAATQAAAGQVLKQQKVKQQVAQVGAQAVEDVAKQTVAGQVANQVKDVVADAVTQQVPAASPQVVEQAAKDAAQSVVQSPAVQNAVQQGQKQANAQGATQAATQAAAEQVLDQAAVQQAIMKAAKQAIAKAQQQNKTQQQIASAIQVAAAEAIRTSAPKASVQKIKQLVGNSIKKVQDERQQKKKANQA